MPKPAANTPDADIWDYNNNYAQVIIVSNVLSNEMVHVSQCETTGDMWKTLVTVQEAKGHETMLAVIWNLLHTIAEENTDMNEHLNKLLGYWEHIVQIDNNDFHISDPMFKVIISLSLPQSWDNFVELFVSLWKGINDSNPKKAVRSQEFIEILTEENLQETLWWKLLRDSKPGLHKEETWNHWEQAAAK